MLAVPAASSETVTVTLKVGISAKLATMVTDSVTENVYSASVLNTSSSP